MEPVKVPEFRCKKSLGATHGLSEYLETDDEAVFAEYFLKMHLFTFYIVDKYNTIFILYLGWLAGQTEMGIEPLHTTSSHFLVSYG